MTTTQSHTKVIALSHIYSYMNLGLFTNIASMGLFKTYLQICLLFRFSPGPLYSSPDPIRRDRFPNNLPLHSGMGCLVSLIRFRHASSLSGVSTLVSISDPFSSVWIFVSTNSRSSTRSRIQWYLRWMCFVLE